MEAKLENKPKNKKNAILAFFLVILIGAAGIYAYTQFAQTDEPDPFVWGEPELRLVTPAKVAELSDEEINVDVAVSALGDSAYSAMSMSLSFDSSRLEFLGIKEGNVFISNTTDASGNAQTLPNWSCNVDRSNETGIVNVIYVDMTGGRYAFTQDLLRPEVDNVIMRLSFRLRGSSISGDELNLIIEDAVFAAADENDSLASSKGTLKIENAKITVGE